MYPVFNGIPGSLSCIPFSKPSSGFHNDTLDSRIPIPLHGVIKEVIVQNCKRFNAMKRNKMDGNLPNTTYKHCWDGFCPSLSWNVSDMWDGWYLEASNEADQLQCLYVFLITKVTFSLAHVKIAPSLQQQLLLNALKRNFALFKTVFKFLRSPHRNSIKKGRISFVWNPSFRQKS